MNPYVDPDVLSANPKFQALYRDLCINKLNPDGTTKLDVKAQKDVDVFQQDLRKARIAAAKRDLLKSYLHSVSYRSDELPEDLQELVTIIAATLDAQISREDSSLLRDDIARFKENLHPISKSIWKLALDHLLTLARIASPDDVSTANAADSLPSLLTTQKSDLESQTETLRSLRLQISHETASLQNLCRKAIETCIKILEQTVHGSVARGTKAKAEYLAIVAEGMERKLQVQFQQLLGRTEFQDFEVLERESVVLKRRIREVEGVLEEYREESGIRGMAREYAEILEESGKVADEILRVEGSG